MTIKGKCPNLERGDAFGRYERVLEGLEEKK